MTIKADMSGKHMRTCIACGETFPKTSLCRIVRTPAGRVDYDPRGRAAGRGAYVCDVVCFDRALKSKRIDRALKTTVSEEEKKRIARVMRDALCDSSE